MEPVKVKSVLIGKGKPKICVPVVAKTAEEIVKDADSFRNLPVDIVEWRADWYEDVADVSKVLDTPQDQRQAGRIPGPPPGSLPRKRTQWARRSWACLFRW